MPSVIVTLGVCLGCLAGVALAACGQSSLTPPKPAPQNDVETRVAPSKPKLEIPRLLAPPPAYGNKIVMARIGAPVRID